MAKKEEFLRDICYSLLEVDDKTIGVYELLKDLGVADFRELDDDLQQIGILKSYIDSREERYRSGSRDGDEYLQLKHRLIPKDKNSVDKIINWFFYGKQKQLEKDDALSELKGWKEKLDLELISREEYYKHKKRLGPIIMQD